MFHEPKNQYFSVRENDKCLFGERKFSDGYVALTLGEALKMLRELQDLNPNDLAHLTGINQANILVGTRSEAHLTMDFAE